jgi:hypothetical protein
MIDRRTVKRKKIYQREKASRRLQFPDMAHVAFANRTHIGSIHSGYCDRFTGKCEKFNFVGKSVTINMHDSSHVARFQAFGWNGGFQHNPFVFFDYCTFHSLCGYAVTNLAIFKPLSTIQIVRTDAVFPFGDSIRPTTTYFWPCGDFMLCVTSTLCANARRASAKTFHSLRRKPNRSKNSALPLLSGCAESSK